MAVYVQVITTVGEAELAQRIADRVVELRLAACAQVVGPVLSTYWWQGKKQTAEEWFCLMKSREDLGEELEQAIREIHPYDVPEILALPVLGGSEDYLKWLSGELKP